MTQQPRQPGSDLVGELQRWLVRSGARSVSRELGGQIRTVLGGGGSHGDVWESATSTHPDEAPECAWCPICRARRRLRESGPGLASHVASAADAVTVVVQDALSAFEAAVAAGRQQAQPRDEPRSGGAVWEEATGEPGAARPQFADEQRSANGVWDTAAADTAGPEAPADPGTEQPPAAAS
ncbi:MAG TPA: hypothetical protein VMV92_06145 [Streptosporangiaceae bacterium]|nr:hypothetical protein [Streptosporangiaceae bacterium]